MPDDTKSRRDAWPLFLSTSALAEYLGLKSTKALYSRIKNWRAQGFPERDPRTGNFYRPAVDAFFGDKAESDNRDELLNAIKNWQPKKSRRRWT